MDKIRWIIFSVVCVIVLGGLALLAGKNKVNVDDINPANIITSSEGSIGDHVYGKKDAKVVVYEYGDFQCPSCGSAFPQIKAIKEEYKDQIAFVFRNFPLTTIHPNALAAATAAEAAGLQGKYWEMHDQLYENQDAWSSADTNQRSTTFAQYASALGLNMDKYNSDLTGKAIADKIARDRGISSKLKLDSTPSIMINDQKASQELVSDLVQGTGDKFRAEIKTQLKAKGVELPAATQ